MPQTSIESFCIRKSRNIDLCTSRLHVFFNLDREIQAESGMVLMG